MHTRSDSSVSQTRISVPAKDGSRTSLSRSLGPVDPARCPAVASSLQSLADALPTGDWLRIKRLTEDVFIAGGFPVPVILRDQLPVKRVLSVVSEDYLERKRKKVMKACADRGKKVPSSLGFASRCVRGFVRMCGEVDVQEVRGHHVQAWVDSLVAEELAPGTVRNKLAAVSGVFGFAVRQGMLPANPCEDVEVPESGAAVLRMPMSDEQFATLLGYLREKELKDWETVCLLARYAGLRLNDATLVCGSGVRFVEDACLVEVMVSKTSRGEVLPVYDPLSSHLRALSGVSGELAPSLASLSPSLLSKRFSAICDEAGIDGSSVALPNGRTHRRLSFHSLRHAFCTDLSRRGVPRMLAMRMSAHVTESCAMRYDHSNALDLHRQVKQFMV